MIFLSNSPFIYLFYLFIYLLQGTTILTTNPPFVGRIRVPMLPNPENLEKAGPKNHFVHNIKLKNPSDFEKIHTIFVN